ncbi:MAG: amidohydrolase family protein [Xanthomonadales bacterium]|nr:amidohydrolase family protein [Xanthomonadales bacterium]
MSRSCVLLAAVLSAGTALAQPDEQRYSVLVAGTRVGHLVATVDGGRVAIDFDFKNNGRGPTMTESLVLDADGLPSTWTIEGTSTFGSRVEERFAREGRSARWTDSTGEGSAAEGGGRLYIGQGASPWALGIYARALLAAPDRSLPVLPAGELRLEVGEMFEVGQGNGRRQVRVHSISGLSLGPTHFLLDEEAAFFAVISPRFVIVREGHEAEHERLGALAERLGRERLEGMQQRLAQRFDAPVRIRDVRLFQPETLELSAAVDVVVSGRRIASVQPAGATPSPGEVLIDGEGGTLVPGMFEMHGHTGQEAALLNLAAGVTSIRDMGNDNAVLAAMIDGIEAGTIAGPRIVRSGFIEGRSPYSSNNGMLVASEEEALSAVRWYAARGFHQVKLYNSMNPAWSAAAVAEAHRLGLRATGHVPAFSNADAMIEAGYDELTHINQIMLGWVLEPEEDTRTLLRLTALKRLDGLDLDSPRVRRTMDAIVANKVAVEPTIAIHENLLLNQHGEVPRGAADYLDHMPVGVQRDARRAWSDMSAPGDREAYAGAWQTLLATVRALRERGVQLIPGTDLGGALTFHRELQLFEEVGFSRAEALRLATLDMARYLGQDQSLGSIETGKLADFFLVAGDPLADLRTLKAIRMVVKDGTVYYPPQIHAEFGTRPFATAPALTLPQPVAAR